MSCSKKQQYKNMYEANESYYESLKNDIYSSFFQKSDPMIREGNVILVPFDIDDDTENTITDLDKVVLLVSDVYMIDLLASSKKQTEEWASRILELIEEGGIDFKYIKYVNDHVNDSIKKRINKLKLMN